MNQFISTNTEWMTNAESVLKICKDPVQFAKLLCEFEPHTGQVKWLHRPIRTNNVLVTGRRWGKSEIEAIDCLHYAVYHPNTRQGIVSITMDQARLSWDSALKYCYNSPFLNAFVKKVRETPFPQIIFKHGSSISVRTAAREGIYIRGHKFDRVLVDEADYLDEQTIDDVIRMTLADVGGPLTLASTPRAKRGEVYTLLRKFEQGDPNIYAQTGPSFENPHIDHEYINTLKDKLTHDGWKREILGQYADDDASVFRFEDIRSAYINNPAPEIFPEEPKPNRLYYAGWDLAKSIDHTVGFVVDATTVPHRVVYYKRFQKQPWPVVSAHIQDVHNRYGCHETYYDATGIGQYVKDVLDGFCIPYVFTKQSKIDLITGLQLDIEKHHVTFPFIRQVVDELQDYEWDDKDIDDTDCVMALALAMWKGGHLYEAQQIPSSMLGIF